MQTQKIVGSIWKIIFWAGLFISPCQAQVSFNTPPLENHALLSAADYATEVLHDPWDMDDIHDLADYFTQETGSTVQNMAVANGILSFDLVGGDSAFFHLLSPGLVSSNPLGKNGINYPIDSTKYRYLSIRMYSDIEDKIHILWYTTIGGPGAKYRRTAQVPIHAGWHTYVIDLETIAYIENGNGETRSWSQAGQITGIRLDPGGFLADPTNPSRRQIDWITLTAPLPSGSGYSIEYSVTPVHNETHHSIAVDDDTNPFNGVLKWLVQDASATAGAPKSIEVDAQGFFYGSYPLIGYVSSDYATLSLANPWDFAASDDVYSLANLTGAIQDGSLSGQTTGSPPQLKLNLHDTSFQAADYPLVCFELTLGQASTGRVYFNDSYRTFTGLAGRHTYSVDMQGVMSGSVSQVAFRPAAEPGIDYQLHWLSVNHSVCQNVDTPPEISTSAGSLIINRPPQLEIIQPDAKGGLDFASSVLGNPWNMNDTGDIVSYSNLSFAAIYPNNQKYGRQGDFFCAANENGNLDPYHPFLDVPKTSALRLPARFRNISITFYVERAQDENSGSTLRIIPGNFERDGNWRWLNGDDTFYQGLRWVTLTQDMTNWTLESVLHPNPPQPIWDGFFNYLRIDIHEATETTYYCIDRVEVREDDTAVNQFAVTYSLEDDDSDPSLVSVSFYYSTSAGAVSGGTPIAGAQDLSITRDSRTVLFDTSALPNGTYYIYGVASDGLNSIAVPATGRVVVDHAATPDTTIPILHLDNPSEGRIQYLSSGMAASGYALDNVQLALVEALIDGSLVKSWVPQEFNKTARSNYPSFADSSNAGFFETIPLTGLALGAHSIAFRACDTSGNCSQLTRSFVLQNGQDPNPVGPPAAENENPINLVSSPPRLALSLTKKGSLTLTITNAEQCADDLILKVALAKKALNSAKALELFSTPGGGVPTLVVQSKSKLAKMTRYGNSSYVYVGLSCGGGAPLASKRFQAGKITNKRGKPKNKYLKYLKSMLVMSATAAGN